MNQKSPTLYDPDPNDPDKRVVNQEATLAAKEKQKAIKERFHHWIFDDPERTERLVRTYNDVYNCTRPRVFDGSHLEFDGMSQDRQLRPHQKDGVWRIMSGGNTLLAHVVGAGKTGVMAAGAMKLKQAGIVKKPVVVVPNHLLEQFAREFQQWYPNAKLLVATKDDFTRDRRKQLTAKIAASEWDAIIVTHSSFEKIGMSREFQEGFLRKQIEEYEELICSRGRNSSKANRNIMKTLEKQKAAREAKLKDLLAEDKKDSGLTFDELGVDYVFYDEAGAVKNLEMASKMDRVAGIQTNGSERAFDMLMKAEYLHQKHPGHGITFANGTPIANSLIEMFTLQRFLDPEGLRSRGIEHFDAWAAQFGEVVESMEISPDGQTLKPRSRFAKFVNLPELQQMFRAFADVQTAEMLNLPRPELEGGKPHIVACPMSEEQEKEQKELVDRYERIRNTKVDPRIDNALAITTDGRKLALDGRMLAPTVIDHSESKINALTENVYAIWQKTADAKSTQIIFSDFGVNPTKWGWSAYEEIIEKLVASGVPREQIASIGDADTDQKKQALFEKVRQGSVRVLIGSTQKLGTGTNVQKRLIALHHLDAPWKPAEVEQREGRILRQGNSNPEVSIYRYVTSGSFDAFMWQTLETKAKFINQIMSGENGLRKAEDVSSQELSYAEVKSLASGNPYFMTLAETDAELQRLGVLRRNHSDEQFISRKKLKELPEQIERTEKRIAALTVDKERLSAWKGEAVSLNGKSYSPNDAVPVLTELLEKTPKLADRAFTLGKFRGMSFGIAYHWNTPYVFLSGQTEIDEQITKDAGGKAVLNALGRIVESYDERIAGNEQDLKLFQTQLADYEARQGRTFQHEGYFKELTELRDQLKMALSDKPVDGGPAAEEIAERITALRGANKVEAAPPRLREKPKELRRKVDRPIPQPVEETKDEPKEDPELSLSDTRPDKPGDGGESPSVSYREVVKPKRGYQPRLF